MQTGRPLKYKTEKELDTKIQEYKSQRDKDSLPYTKISLVLSLGFSDRHALDDSYINNPKFSAIVKKIFLEIESSKVDSMYKENGNTTFTIFDLKCNYGWNDKKAEQESDVTVIDFEFEEVKPES